MDQNRVLLTPVKFRRGTGQMPEWIYQVQPISQYRMYFWQGTTLQAWPLAVYN